MLSAAAALGIAGGAISGAVPIAHADQGYCTVYRERTHDCTISTVPEFKGWLYVRNDMRGPDTYIEHVCARARTEAGNDRDGGGCSPNVRRSCLSGSQPSSKAWGDWDGAAQVNGTSVPSWRALEVHAAAATPADTVGVCGR